ncbi:HSF-type DNA-binding-domain-containing protein [Chlamydoabsidia padenii]|nr:HSF-type DNA-binding-domain-containing protein [Chlamydoabsidia padenii]
MTNFGILNANTINLINATPSSNSNTSINSDGSNNKPAHTNTFVHKLFNMVLDDQFQHLIAWNYTGSSFIVCNIMEFSKDVLPKHFKHNNFSSFVRQLNMYGFHKVNKSPRGHRTSAENQIWEFSHTKFLRGRSDLLDDIKRKAMENDNTKHQGDIQQHLTMLQMSQTDMIQQIHHLFDKCNHVVKELGEAKKRQESQALVIKQLAQLISHQNGGK